MNTPVIERPWLTTAELAELVGVKADSIHHSHSTRGHWNNLRPIKLSNRLLRWRRTDVEKLLAGDAPG